MKILYALGSFYPSKLGGPATVLYWQTKFLQKKDCETAVVTTDIGIDDEKFKNLEIKNNHEYIFYGDHINGSQSIYSKVYHQLKTTEVIHLNSIFEKISIFTFLMSWLFFRKKKIIWSVRGELSEKALKYGTKAKKGVIILYKLLNKNVVYHATSQKEREEINAVFPNNKIVIVANYMPTSERLNVEKANQFTFVGRIHPIKKIENLIQAAINSEKFKNSNYTILIAGKATDAQLEYLESLKKMVRDHLLNEKIIFLGHIDGDEKEHLFAKSKFMVLPSETENFGNVVIEALNQRTPVIASLGTPWEILNKNNAGFHISNHPDTLKKYLEISIEMSDSEYENLSLNAEKLVDQEFNLESQIHNWIQVYRNLNF